MTEQQLREQVTTLIERAYLGMTDRGDPGEEWPPGTLEDLAAAVEAMATLARDYGDEALARALGDVRALGEMRAELLAAAAHQIAYGDDQTE
jgi:hypothetical protein